MQPERDRRVARIWNSPRMHSRRPVLRRALRVTQYLLSGMLVTTQLLAAQQPSSIFASEGPGTAPSSDSFRISSPLDQSVLGDGDLILVEGVDTELDASRDDIEVAIDDGEWAPAQRDADDPTRWQY